MTLDQIGQYLQQVNEKLNMFLTNAKKIFELPTQTDLNPNSRVVVYNPETQTTQQLEVSKIINGIVSTYVDSLISIGELLIDGNDITVPSACQWKISQVVYYTSTDTVFTVPFSEAGKTRIDIIVGNTSNELQRIEGIETSGIAIRPNIPLNTVLVTQINVSEDSFATVESTLFKGEFESYLDLTTQHPIAISGSYAIVNTISSSAVYFYSVTSGSWLLSTSDSSVTSIPYLTLRLKAKGNGNTASTLEAGDMVEGFKDATTYWNTALYNGGDATDRDNYTPIVETELT